MRIFKNMYEAVKETQRDLHEMGTIVKIRSFQNLDVSEKEERNTTKEINGHTFRITDPGDEVNQDKAYKFLFKTDEKIGQHKKWSIAEFQERIHRSGTINPGKAWMERREVWEEFLNKEGKMDYSYNERYYKYDQLQRIIFALNDDITSRRCVLQVYQTEQDLLGIEELKRVPCSVSYSWLFRNGKLNIFYHMRSCDFYEHFLNDMVLTTWLNEFIAQELEVDPGDLIVYINSLHAYKKDLDERNIF